MPVMCQSCSASAVGLRVSCQMRYSRAAGDLQKLAHKAIKETFWPRLIMGRQECCYLFFFWDQ